MVTTVRVQVVDEDADDSGVLICKEEAPVREEPAMPMTVLWPSWQCDDCGQRWEGRRYVCGYCGLVRDDADALP